MGSGIRRVGWDHSLGIRDHKPWDRDQQFFRDQAVPFWWDQGPKSITRLESKITEKFGYKNGFSNEKTYFITTLFLWCA